MHQYMYVPTLSFGDIMFNLHLRNYLEEAYMTTRLPGV